MSDENGTIGSSVDGGSVARQTTSSSATGCPDAQRLAAYVDGTLTPGERDEVDAHLGDCEACREVVAEAVRTTDALEASGAKAVGEPAKASIVDIVARRPQWAQWGVGSLAAAALVTIAVLVPWRSLLGLQSSDQKRMAALVEAVGDHRPFEPRLTGGFGYGPLAPVMRSGGDGREVDMPPETRLAAGELAKADETHPGARTAAGHAAGALVLGDIDTAIRLLEQATQEAPMVGTYWNDLAAAYLVRASRRGDPDAVAQALAAVDLALALEPKLAEALFNRALVLDALGRQEEADLTWRTYLSVDPASGWAAEVKARLAQD
jgi:hypothetical protein